MSTSCLFTHVGDNLGMYRGADAQPERPGVGRVHCSRARARTRPARPGAGKSALDAVELMDVGWNFRREHLRLAQRSHYVITNGGDQPNVVPPTASVWYYFREADYDAHQGVVADRRQHGEGRGADDGHHFHVARARDRRGRGTSTSRSPRPCTRTSRRSACRSGSEDDQTLAKALQQRAEGCPKRAWRRRSQELRAPLPSPTGEATKAVGPTGGGSDDIGDVSWVVPTVTLSYPSNIPGCPGHNWANAISMATPIAHKGVIAGAKVQAHDHARPADASRTGGAGLGLLPERPDQGHEVSSRFLRPEDKPAIWLNEKTMGKYRERMKHVLLRSGEVRHVPGPVGH